MKKEKIKTSKTIKNSTKNLQKKRINVHILTDLTGETTVNICKAVMSQFPNVQYETFIWSFIKTIQDAKMAIDGVIKNPGIIIYTVLQDEVIKYIQDSVKDHSNIIVVHALSHIIQSFSRYTGRNVNHMISRDAEINSKEFFNRMDAIQYAIDHDDGQSIQDIDDADMIIVGVSRISKTPTSRYLAFQGYKVANIPYFSNAEIPEQLYKLSNAIVIGLTIDPLRLLQLRESRSLSINKEYSHLEYATIDHIQKELNECRHLFAKLSCPVIDVSHKSVEETSSQILKVYNFLRKSA